MPQSTGSVQQHVLRRKACSQNCLPLLVNHHGWTKAFASPCTMKTCPSILCSCCCCLPDLGECVTNVLFLCSIICTSHSHDLCSPSTTGLMHNGSRCYFYMPRVQHHDVRRLCVYFSLDWSSVQLFLILFFSMYRLWYMVVADAAFSCHGSSSMP